MMKKKDISSFTPKKKKIWKDCRYRILVVSLPTTRLHLSKDQTALLWQEMEVDPLAPLYLPSKEQHKGFYCPYKMISCKGSIYVEGGGVRDTLVWVEDIVPSTNAWYPMCRRCSSCRIPRMMAYRIAGWSLGSQGIGPWCLSACPKYTPRWQDSHLMTTTTTTTTTCMKVSLREKLGERLVYHNFLRLAQCDSHRSPQPSPPRPTLLR